RAGLDVDRDAAPGVPHLDGVVLVEDDLDRVPVAAERLVDGVVQDLPEAVHEPPGVGRTDGRARSRAHGAEAFEDVEVAGVGGGLRGGAAGGHAPDATCPSTSNRVSSRAGPRTGPAAAACAVTLTRCCSSGEPRLWTLPRRRS